jgi:hypothetical protein
MRLLSVLSVLCVLVDCSSKQSFNIEQSIDGEIVNLSENAEIVVDIVNNYGFPIKLYYVDDNSQDYFMVIIIQVPVMSIIH